MLFMIPEKVTDGSLFICIRGVVVDGHKFIPRMTAKGAKVLIVEEEVSKLRQMLAVIQVTDTRYAMAFYFQRPPVGHPAEKLKTNGITGTKWKNHYYLYGKIHSGKWDTRSTDRYY